MLTTEIVAILATLADDILAELAAVPPEALNWRPPIADTNSMVVLATHTVGAGEWLILHLACGQPMNRDRGAEFRAEGDLEPLRARYAAWIDNARAAVAALPDSELSLVRRFNSSSGPQERTVAWCLLHALDHTANHLGHIQLTRQLWERERAATKE